MTVYITMILVIIYRFFFYVSMIYTEIQSYFR